MHAHPSEGVIGGLRGSFVEVGLLRQGLDQRSSDRLLRIGRYAYGLRFAGSGGD